MVQLLLLLRINLSQFNQKLLNLPPQLLHNRRNLNLQLNLLPHPKPNLNLPANLHQTVSLTLHLTVSLSPGDNLPRPVKLSLAVNPLVNLPVKLHLEVNLNLQDNLDQLVNPNLRVNPLVNLLNNRLLEVSPNLRVKDSLNLLDKELLPLLQESLHKEEAEVVHRPEEEGLKPCVVLLQVEEVHLQLEVHLPAGVGVGQLPQQEDKLPNLDNLQ